MDALSIEREHHVVSTYRNYGAPLISRKGSRFNNDYIKKSREVPGPGSYRPKYNIDPKGIYTLSKWKSSCAQVFPKGGR